MRGQSWLPSDHAFFRMLRASVSRDLPPPKQAFPLRPAKLLLLPDSPSASFPLLCQLGFFFLLRVSEVARISRRSLFLSSPPPGSPPSSSPSVCLRILKSKTDQAATGTLRPLPCVCPSPPPRRFFCPAHAAAALLQLPSQPDGSWIPCRRRLPTDDDRTAVLSAFLRQQLPVVLMRSNLRDPLLSLRPTSHGLRRGGTAFLLHLDTDRESVRAWGRWSPASRSFARYADDALVHLLSQAISPRDTSALSSWRLTVAPTPAPPVQPSPPPAPAPAAPAAVPAPDALSEDDVPLSILWPTRWPPRRL